MAIIKVTLLLKLLQTNFMFLFDFNIHTVHYLKLSISPLTISMVQTTLLQLQLHTIDFIYYVGGHGALNLFDLIPIFYYIYDFCRSAVQNRIYSPFKACP